MNIPVGWSVGWLVSLNLYVGVVTVAVAGVEL